MRRVSVLLVLILLAVGGAVQASAPRRAQPLFRPQGRLGESLVRLPIASPAAEYQVAFRSSRGTYLIVSDANALLRADSPLGSRAATFVLRDRNGGGLASGDVVNLVCRGNGRYVCAEAGGGREVRADRVRAGEWEELTLVRADGDGPIRNGDAVALRASDGHYLSAVEGGGREVVARGHEPGPWERFTIEIRRYAR